MNLHELVSDLIANTRDVSVPLFKPELSLCATIVLMLLIKVFPFGRFVDSFFVALLGTAVALYHAAPWAQLDAERTELFTGMLVYDGFTVYIRAILLVFVLLFLLFTRLSGLPNKDDGADIYSLVLGSTLGMCLMASANHLLMVFMAIEMASVPSYALAGMLKGRRQSSEAALKYAVFGAGTAGVMLYGISLIAGLLNTAHLPTLAIQLATRLPSMPSEEVMVLAMAALMIAVGLAFKLSAVPFHFWCPDVFEGATAEVNAFLSVASKAAALALLVRVAIGFGHVPEKATQVAVGEAMFAVADEAAQKPQGEDAKPSVAKESVPQALATAPPTSASLAPVRNFMAKLIAFLAIITCTFGNLAAYGQTNVKRLFAYSTIAHAGYMMMAIPALLAVLGTPAATDAGQNAVAALGMYIVVYVSMNLGVFAIIAFWRNALRSEEIADYAGLIRRCPVTVVCFTMILFSLVGLPLFAGFFGKFVIFAAVWDSFVQAGNYGVSAGYLVWLLVTGGINTAISLYYYLRIVKVMTIDSESPDRPPLISPIGIIQNAFVCLLTLPTVGWLLCWKYLNDWSISAASHLF